MKPVLIGIALLIVLVAAILVLGGYGVLADERRVAIDKFQADQPGLTKVRDLSEAELKDIAAGTGGFTLVCKYKLLKHWTVAPQQLYIVPPNEGGSGRCPFISIGLDKERARFICPNTFILTSVDETARCKEMDALKKGMRP